VFSRYTLVLSRDGVPPITIDPAGNLASSGVSRELAVGTWTAEVTAYRTFTVTGGTANKSYPVAKGSTTLTVVAGQTTPVTVPIAPIPIAEADAQAEPGIFTYTVTFPGNATGTLRFGNDDPVPLVSGAKVSVEKPAGYYDVTVSLTQDSLSAGIMEKAHIYAGLESRVTFNFGNEDFTPATVYLAGTLSLPEGATISIGRVWPYSDPAHTISIAAAASVATSASWTISVPFSRVGSVIYLVAEISGEGGKHYVMTGDSGGPITETGKRGIVLSDTTPPADITGLTATPDFDAKEVTLNWINPLDEDVDHIEITVSPEVEGIPQSITVPKGTRSETFTGLTGDAYTFTVRTVDIAGNQSGGAARTVEFSNFTTISAVEAFLDAVPDEATAAISVNFSLAANGLATLLTTIQAAGKSVALDLSACAMSETTFNPGTANTGESKIVSLVLPNTATSIKAGSSSSPTFKNWTALTSVSGSGIASIGTYAFSGCADLTTTDFPEATSIGERAFSGCTGLTTADFPAAETIGGYAFYGCAALTTADFPAATSIGTEAFRNCAALTTADFPLVTTIGSSAFYNCAKLTTADFPAATSIGINTFYGCAALTTADFPAATSIGGYAFYGCAALTTADFPAATSIGEQAFSGYAALTTADFPLVTSIGNNAFQSCTKLTTADFPEAASIGERAFSGCTGLTEADFPVAETIGYEAFSNCTGLTTADFPEAASIGERAFSGCTGLTEADFPVAETIGGSAFYYCTGLTTADIPAATSIGTYAFSGCAALTTADFPEATTIGGSAFSGCAALTTVNAPAATSIGGQAFASTGTTALTVTLGSTAPTLKYDMFYQVFSAKTVTVLVPSDATGYVPGGTDLPATYSGSDSAVNWGNGFRGRGWTGSAFTSSTTSDLNSYITLTIQAIVIEE
jgi:hypothetical protein